MPALRTWLDRFSDWQLRIHARNVAERMERAEDPARRMTRGQALALPGYFVALLASRAWLPHLAAAPARVSVALLPLPFIVAGDFNTSDQDAMYPALAARMIDSFRERGVGFGTSWPSPGMLPIPVFLPPLVRIDYIWHSPGISTRAAWQARTVGSDHLPLVADLVIEAS